MANAEKRVLVLAYYFPPMGMGGVQRVTKLVKYLPQFGWTPEVITVKPVRYHADDPSLLSEIDSIKVHRTGSFDPLRIAARFHRAGSDRTQHIGRLRHRLNGWLIPDNKILWLPFALWRAFLLHRAQPFDAILTTSPPHSVHLAGRFLKRILKLPWLADFRDGWWFEPHEKRTSDWQARTNERQLLGVLNHFDDAVTVSVPLAAQFESRCDRRVQVIPNGFDPDDFQLQSDTPDKSNFILTYCGTLTQTMHPRQGLEAISLAMSMEPKLADQLKLHWVGKTLDFDLEGALQRWGLQRYSRIHGYLTHRSAVSRIQSSDVLLFLLPTGYGPGVVTGKLYEYLASGKPIWGIAVPGDSSKLIERYHAGRVYHPEAVQSAAEGLIDRYHDWRENRSETHAAYRPALTPLMRQTQAGQFAELLNHLERK